MSSTMGKNVTVTLYGESHGPEIGAVLDGMAPGIAVDEKFIRKCLTLRRPFGDISTARREDDLFEIVSGVYHGRTTGTPLCIRIPNSDVRSGDYEKNAGLARPGHADYAAACRYHGFEDPRGGGHFSGRITAALVAVGAIALGALNGRGIRVGTHIRRCAGIEDRPFLDLSSDIEALWDRQFPVLNEQAGEEMRRAVLQAAREGDSVGGILETAVIGVPAGIGGPWFDTVEGALAHALLGIPAVKGIQFGLGFDGADERGSRYNDEFYMDGGTVKTRTNHNGGVNGGITNGMPVAFSLAVKPTPSIAKAQRTVNYLSGEDTVIETTGRHDPCILHRARIVVDCVTALVLCDLLAGRYGTDWLKEG